jgi:hypothetical protein
VDGFLLLDGPRRTGDGYYESMLEDPEGDRIVIAAPFIPGLLLCLRHRRRG